MSNELIKIIVQNLANIVITIAIPIVAVWIKKKLDTDNKLAVAKRLAIIADDIVNYYKQIYANNTWLDQADAMIDALLAQFPDIKKDVATRIINSAITKASN